MANRDLRLCVLNFPFLTSALLAQCEPPPQGPDAHFDVVSGATINPVTSLFTTTVGIPVTFQARETNSLAQFTWTFEGVDSHERWQAIHTFANPGDSAVHLQVEVPTCPGGTASAGAAMLIHVKPAAPLTDAVVVVGSGTLGSWTTRFDLANPTSSPLQVQLSPAFPEFQSACPNPCPWVTVTIPANGSTIVMASDIPGIALESINSIFISANDPVALPVVRARVLNTASPPEGIELPAVRLSTLISLDAAILNFPSALRNADAHTNLAVAAISDCCGQEPVAVRVELFGADGSLMGSGTFTNAVPGGAPQNIFLGDIAGQLGVQAVEDGVIRVTKLSGNGGLWGETSTVYPSGSVSVSVGRNP
jgi:hypothetical protein